MGWNNIKIENFNELLDGLSDNSYFYFVHSYYPLTKSCDDVAASTIYGEKFASVVSKKNIYGCQFHPEKSGKTGLRLLENFARMTRK
jgi:glutamine amidotransferase